MYNLLDTITACDRRTDILPRHIVRAMHTRRAVKIEHVRYASSSFENCCINENDENHIERHRIDTRHTVRHRFNAVAN